MQEEGESPCLTSAWNMLFKCPKCVPIPHVHLSSNDCQGALNVSLEIPGEF